MFAKQNKGENAIPTFEPDADLLECLGAEAWISLPPLPLADPDDDAAETA
ncbi:hypothetical protein [Chitinimonas sp.]